MELPEHLADMYVHRGVASGNLYIRKEPWKPDAVFKPCENMTHWWDKFSDDDKNAVLMASIMGKVQTMQRINMRVALQTNATISVAGYASPR